MTWKSIPLESFFTARGGRPLGGRGRREVARDSGPVRYKTLLVTGRRIAHALRIWFLDVGGNLS